jgi:hypothetical protein
MGEGNAAMQSGGGLPEPGERDIEDSKIHSAVSVTTKSIESKYVMTSYLNRHI